MGYSSHMGRRFPKEFKLYLREVMVWQQRRCCFNLGMLYIAAIIEAEPNCSAANQQVSSTAELNISTGVTCGDIQSQNNPSLQSNIEEF